MNRRKLRYMAEYSLFQGFLFCVRCLPVRTARSFADAVAWFLHNMIPRRLTRYQVADENLQVAFGASMTAVERDAVICGMWRHLFRMVVEIVQLPRRLRLYNCADVLDFTGRDECVQAMCSGRPVLFLGGHFGNWEISVNTFGHFGFPMGVVARDLDNPYLHEWFRRFRESTGNTLISKDGGSSELVEIMERGGMASLLCDQDAGRGGLFVDFFGKPASTFKSIGLLALQYNALIVVGGAWRLPDTRQDGRWVRFNLTTQDVIDPADHQGVAGLAELTQRFTQSLEQLIRRAPEQYFWVHRRWKSEPRVRERRSRVA